MHESSLFFLLGVLTVHFPVVKMTLQNNLSAQNVYVVLLSVSGEPYEISAALHQLNVWHEPSWIPHGWLFHAKHQKFQADQASRE